MDASPFGRPPSSGAQRLLTVSVPQLDDGEALEVILSSPKAARRAQSARGEPTAARRQPPPAPAPIGTWGHVGVAPGC